jgi:polar amino acid transport system permease protein
MKEFSTFEIVTYLIIATRWTIALSLIAFIGGGIAGLIITILRIFPIRIFNYVASAYIQFIQGTPLLMQLFVAFFGLSLFGIEVSAWFAAAVALIAWTGAFLGEIWRGCIQAIPRTQWEASASLGLGFMQQLRYVILPQAFKISIPPTVGFLVQVIKGTSLASVIGFIELTRAATALNNVTFRPFLVFLIIGAIYFSLCYPLSVCSQRMERRLIIVDRSN